MGKAFRLTRSAPIIATCFAIAAALFSGTAMSQPAASPTVPDTQPEVKTIKAAPLKQVPLPALLHQTQKSFAIPGRVSLIWWIPTTYWRVALTQNGKPASMIDKVASAVAPYTFVVVSDGEMVFGTGQFVSPAKIEKTAKLKVRGHTYKPLNQTKLSMATQALITRLKPVFAQMLGNMGKHMAILVFPGKDKQGRQLADPLSAGAFQFFADGASVSFQTPVTALLVPTFCPLCHRTFPGGYRYCPYDRTPLVLTHENAPAAPMGRG